MKKLITILSIQSLLFGLANFSFAQKNEKIIAKGETRYKSGAYKAAYRYNKALISKSEKSNFNTQNLCDLYFNQALAAEAMYKYVEMEELIKKGTELLEKSSADSGSFYSKGLAKLALINYQAGKYEEAEKNIKKAIELSKNKIEASKFKLLQSKILTERYFLNEALALQNLQSDFWLKRASKTKGSKSDVDSTKKLSKNDVKSRKLEYADYLNVSAAVLLKKGAYSTFDSSISKNDVWMAKNIKKRNLQYRDLLHLKAQRAETKGDLKNALKLYEETNKYTKYNKIEKTGVLVQDKLAYLYFVKGKKRESVKNRVKFQRAAEEYYGKNSLHYGKFRYQEVRELYTQGKYDRADKRLTNIYKIKTELPQNHTFVLNLGEMKTQLNIKKSNFDAAQDTINKGLSIKSTLLGINAPAYHLEKLKLSDFSAKYTSNFNLAKDIYENSFEKIVAPQLSNENLLKSKLLQQQAYTYDLLEKYDLAIKYLEQAESNISKYYGKNNIEYASELEKLASVLIKRGDYAKSEELLKQALAILQLIDNRSNAGEKSTIYLTVAKLYSTLGMYEEAESALIKASKYSKKTRKTEKMAEVKSADEIASLYIKEGRFNEADELLKSTYTIKLKKLGEGNRELIPTLNLMGNLNIIVGNYGAAEKNIRQSMALSAKIFTENSLKYTEALRILEKLYSELGDVDKAEQTDNQILTIQKALLGNKHIDVAATLTRLALIKTYSGGDKAEAEKMLTEALEIIKFNLGEQSPAYADQLKNNAYFYIEAKRYPEAETAIDAADKIYTAKLGQKNVFRAELSLLKGNVYVLQEKFVPAQQKYLESKNLFADIFSTKHPNYVKATSKLARTYYINKEYPKSLKLLDEATANYLDFTKKYFPSLSFSEKSKYWNQIKEDFEFYNSLAFKMMEKSPAVLGSVYNNMLSTKAILLSSSIKVKQRILASKDQTLINKYNDWVAKKQFLISVLSMSKDAQTQLGVTPEGLEKEIQLLEKDLSESSELFAGSFDKKNVSWIDVRKSLRENEYAVEIIRFRSYKNTFTDSIIYAALIINKNTDKAPQIAVLPNGKQLENRYLKYYKNAVITKSGEDDESYGAYWAPIKKVIPDNATIYLSSEGVYNELNVESLQASNGKYVIDENFVIPVSNTKDLLTRSKTTKNTKLDASKAVLIGNPVFYASAATSTKANNTGFDTERSIARPNLQSVGLIKQLPGTETEVNEITKLFNNKNWNVKLLTQQITDEDSLKNLKSPKILHIATHGYFNPNIEETKEGMSSTEMDFAQNPLLRSGILLKNAGDILKNNSSLKINSENGVLTAYEAMDLNLDHTDLVVLSACETGKGDVQIGEGVFGLQRSILIAGAQHLVMTLFKVDDEVTKELMINFYSRWLETGELRKSFTEAKKIVKDKYKYPVYWGSFVMLGVD